MSRPTVICHVCKNTTPRDQATAVDALWVCDTCNRQRLSGDPEEQPAEHEEE